MFFSEATNFWYKLASNLPYAGTRTKQLREREERKEGRDKEREGRTNFPRARVRDSPGWPVKTGTSTTGDRPVQKMAHHGTRTGTEEKFLHQVLVRNQVDFRCESVPWRDPVARTSELLTSRDGTRTLVQMYYGTGHGHRGRETLCAPSSSSSPRTAPSKVARHFIYGIQKSSVLLRLSY